MFELSTSLAKGCEDGTVAASERVRSLVLYEPVLFRLLSGDALTDLFALGDETERVCQAGDPAAAGRAFIDYWSGAGTWQRISAAQQAELAQAA